MLKFNMLLTKKRLAKLVITMWANSFQKLLVFANILNQLKRCLCIGFESIFLTKLAGFMKLQVVATVMKKVFPGLVLTPIPAAAI